MFVCGLGRSGTTALARVLAAHPRVVLGIERYKRLWPADRIGELGPAHFTRERFFDFSDDLTNLTPQSSGVWAAHYARMAERFATARYVGDKITKLPLLALHAAFPDARFVCIVREAAQTAYSWQARAEDEADLGWPGDHDAERAVRRWNKSLRLLLEADTVIPGSLQVVEYDAFFGADPDLRATLDWLDLDLDPAVRAEYAAASTHYHRVLAAKDRRLDDGVADFVTQHADDDAWRRVLDLTEARPRA